MAPTLDDNSESPRSRHSSYGAIRTRSRLDTGEEGASPARGRLGPALQPAGCSEPAGDSGVMPALVGDGLLPSVGHALECERFVEQLHGGFS
jgi:hypothetical protein